ncbi:MAG: ComEC/Rec2 family competence protein [Pseudobdellovibrionaceae bacterium]
MLKQVFLTTPVILFLVFALVLFSATPLKEDGILKSYWIIWNVGQGQWSTLVDQNTCDHFDMGGERNPLRQVKKICADKMNHVYLSHWDWDHISFALKSRFTFKNICLSLAPLGVASPHKMKLLQEYGHCAVGQKESVPLKEVTDFREINSATNSVRISKKNSNDLSHVLLVAEDFLIPGDSTISQEQSWSHRLPMQKVRFLLLGHHGSRTSTSEELLSQLPGLKVAIASARFAKYGHPHQEVVQRLKKHQVILLKTEDWGNLWFETRLH